MSEYILRATNIHKRFAGVHALKGVDLAIKKGEIHSLAGENGCGKSTLIKVISGVYKPDGGTIEIDGTEYQKLEPAEAMLRGVQVIYQDLSIFPSMTVAENIVFYSQITQKKKLVNWKQMRSKAVAAMELIGLKLDPDELVENLSVADKQMIAICRALVNDGKLIIMDEATTALTKKEVRALFAVIKSLQARGISTLFVSHKIDEVFEISERFTIFRNGENVISSDTKDLDNEKFAYYMTGRQLDKTSYKTDVTQAETALELKDLSLKGGFKHISFSAKKGEILGVTGLLGSGRTELALSLYGIYPAQSGKIFVNGKETAIRSIQDAIKAGIGYLPEDRLTEGLFMEQSIGDNAVVTVLDRLSKAFGWVDRRKYADEIDRWVKELAIATPNAGNAVQTLSGGNQQRVVLAKLLAKDYQVLVLNGPTVGVDIGSKHDIYKILEGAASQGKTVIVISDDLLELKLLCKRILVMKDGMLVDEIDTDVTSAEEIADVMAGELPSAESGGKGA